LKGRPAERTAERLFCFYGTGKVSMDFAFTPEQIELRRAVRDFAEAEIRPHVRKWDDSETFTLEIIKQLDAS